MIPPTRKLWISKTSPTTTCSLLTADQLKTAHTEGERLLDERTRVGKAA